VTTPGFFSKQWADSVRDALTAGPSAQARAGKLQEYWDFFDRIRDAYQASWALGCRDLGPAYLFIQWGGGTVTDCHVIGPDDPPPTFSVHGGLPPLLRTGDSRPPSPPAVPPGSVHGGLPTPVPPGPSPFMATYVLGMDYRDWKALHEGYDAQRTVMYRKIVLEDGNLLEFFKGIYFFVECLAVIGAVPADYPAR
jgi:hypothetical protein